MDGHPLAGTAISYTRQTLVFDLRKMKKQPIGTVHQNDARRRHPEMPKPLALFLASAAVVVAAILRHRSSGSSSMLSASFLSVPGRAGCGCMSAALAVP
jgi:hypothetical protein